MTNPIPCLKKLVAFPAEQLQCPNIALFVAGWTYRKSGKLDLRQEGNVKIYGVPYSEHSSFPELRSCVQLLRPKKLIPTVNATNHAAMETIVSRFAVSTLIIAAPCSHLPKNPLPHFPQLSLDLSSSHGHP